MTAKCKETVASNRINDQMCVCGDIQTMLHIVDSCPLTKLDCGLQRLHAV